MTIMFVSFPINCIPWDVIRIEYTDKLYQHQTLIYNHYVIVVIHIISNCEPRDETISD